ncbi:unannotated protein [freshwater metagenome]|uniref:Unannotated protein n=1 Tax=freshwater metagenome TaxID=449393 RepID=A0A6J7IMC4_9ZZZZ|nr:hypothetical protein [Actinomycetota bacterium]
MLAGEKTVVIDAQTADVWATIADVAAYPQWHPFFTAVEVTQRDASDCPMRARCEHPTPVGVLRTEMGFTYDGTTSLRATRHAGDLKAMVGAFALEPADQGTAVTHRIEIEPGMRLGMLLRGPVEDRVRASILDGALDGLAAHLRIRS